VTLKLKNNPTFNTINLKIALFYYMFQRAILKELMADRTTEIKKWVEQNSGVENYVIIDDDLSLNHLPTFIEDKWVATKPLIGLDEESTLLVISKLNRY
jgi:hypothetical protein